jgi:hypothetical protein
MNEEARNMQAWGKRLVLATAVAVAVSGFGIPVANKSAHAVSVVNDSFDGYAAEWASIDYDSASFGTGLAQFKAMKTDERLYLYVEGSGLDAGNNIFYIDSDNNPETGVAVSAWSNAGGIDYKIVNDQVFRYENADWVQAGTAELAASATGIEVFADLAALGATAAARVKVGYALAENDFLPKVGGKLLTVDAANPGAGVQSLSITTDGSVVDWVNISPSYVTKDGKSQMYTARDSQNLYVMLKGFLPDVWTDLFLDTDHDALTGCTAFIWPDLGAEYLIEGPDLFKSKGRVVYEWDALGQKVEYSITKNNGPDNETIMEYRIPLSEIGITAETKIRLGFASMYGDGFINKLALPDETDALFTLYDMPAAPLVLDGNGEDWSNIGFVTGDGASQTPVELRAVQDHKKLYMMIETSEPSLNTVYYIDSDNNGATGLSNAGWSNSGIDYKVERDKLYKYTGTGADSTWEPVGDVYAGFNADSMEVSLNLSQIGKTEPGAMKIGYIGNGSLYLPAASEEMLTSSKIVQRSTIPNAYYPDERYEALYNPLIGWAPLAVGGPYPQPHKLAYIYVTWKELEPLRDQFAWEAFEQKYKFQYWADRGVKLIVRIVMDYPLASAHRDIPDWLYTEIDGDGTEYNDGSQAGFSPNYSNPKLIEEHERLIGALAARYDDDSRVAYIALGSVGQWGEWHTGAIADPFPPTSITDQYVQHYIDSFNHKLIGIRKPFEIAKNNRLGLFNDMMGTKAGTDEWLDWIQNGNGSPSSAMPDFWKTNYSGGEFSYGAPQTHLADNAILETLRQIKASHNSWIGPATAAWLATGTPQQGNIDLAMKTMGYRFVLESASHEPTAKAGNSISVAMQWKNRGIAPIYYAYPLELSLLDSNGEVAASTRANADLRTWLPGKTSLTSQLAIPTTLKAGTYRLAVAILDPDTGLPAVDLAISGRNSDGRYVLDTIDIAAAEVPSTGSPGNNTGTPSTPQPSEKPDSNESEGNTGSPSTEPDIKLSDVPSTHWAASLIRQATKLGIVDGFPDGTFKPGRKVSRSEFTAMLVRGLKLEDASVSLSFKDKADIPGWSLPYLEQAVQAGILAGYPDGTIRALREVTRTDAVVMLVRALKLELKPNATLPFKDAKDIPNWAKPYMAAAFEAGIIEGDPAGNFNPMGIATRAEAVKMILAALQK